MPSGRIWQNLLGVALPVKYDGIIAGALYTIFVSPHKRDGYQCSFRPHCH
ncbi:hypothetical protein F441_20034 [Phytophthora nicotianae CJ01A1]|uniref:Uncharacterized protein n=4 Tax=Phytophthora nicotianae TaxID=4792 RepID=V9E493_PHYNI|nr:hypothetical protein F443_20161 [Phytophthora nicotianae P1569]ETK73453.1 hypothetical protein L915_19613 [Phytophthora nicotianae]ETO61861.1 hypothetical protein F444_20172 [Phytophthora nicotianae P1976]ETP02952.1 hypothetical protein F441_20034 [Phytophthora nicotianae CJ01A1]ETL26884.1 hypothetical protein L916_19503 [Phytophthora nicotianae]